MEAFNDSFFLNVLKTIIKYKRKFIWINLSIFILSSILAFALPKWYRGNTLIMVNEQQMDGMFSSIASELPINLLPSFGTSVDQYMNFIYTRKLLDNLDSIYHLQNTYEIESRKKFYKELRGNIEIIDNEDNTFTVNFFYKNDPRKAAEIANSIFLELENISLGINSEKNRKIREYLEQSYEKTLATLYEYENQLTQFQIENQVFEVRKQIESMIMQISDLEVEKIKLKIELDYLLLTQGNTPQKTGIKQKIQIIDKRINEIIEGPYSHGLSLNEIPAKAKTYFDLYRNVLIYEKVLEFIVPQLEKAHIEEVKMTSDIQLIDRAYSEDLKTYPKRLSIIFTSSFFGLILSILFLRIYDKYENNKTELKNFLFRS